MLMTKKLSVAAMAAPLLTAVALAMPAISVAQAPVPVAPSVRGLPDFTDLVEQVGPAVVNIRTVERVRAGAGRGGQVDEEMQEFFRRFFGIPLPNVPRQGPRQAPQEQPEREVPRGVGSGFIISPDGFLLTNHPVVEGADEIYVTLTDKRELKGRLIGSDRRTDVALVKIEGANLPAMRIGDPQRLRVGEWVVAIGSPFGLDNTVTAGIVSAKGRDTGDYLPFIQTDVAVNPGNSGGPLLNMRGEVIGINSQIYSRTGGFMGLSFAIPINVAMDIQQQLRTKSRVTRGRIGVGIAEVTKDVAEPLGLPRAAGALVRNVEPGGPAERGGIEVGDIILKYDGKDIQRSTDLPRMVGNTKPGTKVPVTVWRKGATRELAVTVAEMQPEQQARNGGGNRPQPTPGGSAQQSNALGLVVADIPEERRGQLRIKGGVLVEAADGAAARAGIRPGDVILSLNNQDVTGARQFNEAVSKLDRTKTHIMLVRRGESAQFVPIRPAGQGGQ